jgi:hypothetical protein
MEVKENNSLLFIQLINQNQHIALMSMGKIENPVSKKSEKNIEYAKFAIDTLDMLQIKTKGNLSEYEEKYIQETINELKLMYVEVFKK